MSEQKPVSLAEALREKFADDVTSKIQCRDMIVNGRPFEYCWRPLTGAQQREIQKFASKSIAEGICAHIKVRAIDRNGNPIFAGVPITSLMNDYNFQDDLLPMFNAMTGEELTPEDIEKN